MTGYEERGPLISGKSVPTSLQSFPLGRGTSLTDDGCSPLGLAADLRTGSSL